MAAGLAAVHEQHLVHRDIKPTNIMVMLKEGGTVAAKIIDLGLAKTVDASASAAGISSPGTFAGTPEFASPEQFTGIGVDIRSDLYSLGVTLWVMVTGQTLSQVLPLRRRISISTHLYRWGNSKMFPTAGRSFSP